VLLVAKNTYPYQGRMVPGEPLEFEATTPEAWSTYRLSDGTMLKVKTIVLNVARLDEYGPDGTPLYQFQAQQVVTVQAPDSLKRKVQ
jgi:hypothetical protein